MKCWVTQQILPLYISNDANRISSCLIGRHLDNCVHCRTEYEKYQNSHNMLKHLKEISPPTQLFGEDYWKGIKTGITSLPQNHTVGKRYDYYRISAAAILLIAIGFVFGYIKSDFSQVPPSSLPAQLQLTAPHTIPTSFKLRASESIGVPLSKPENSEYELNEVSPLEINKCIF